MATVPSRLSDAGIFEKDSTAMHFSRTIFEFIICEGLSVLKGIKWWHVATIADA